MPDSSLVTHGCHSPLSYINSSKIREFPARLALAIHERFLLRHSLPLCHRHLHRNRRHQTLLPTANPHSVKRRFSNVATYPATWRLLMSRESSTHLPVQPKLIRSRTLNRPGF